MSVISSNSLFHFTSSVDSLIGILRNNFFARYSYESYRFLATDTNSVLDGGIPMVCFCDLSLSQIKGHIKLYGNYGLGMTKAWGEKKGLNPILYISEDSILSKNLDLIVNHFVENNLYKIFLDQINSKLILLSYIKPYMGNFNYRNIQYANYRYYNEREWRYIPDLKDQSYTPFLLNKKDYDINIIRTDFNDRLESNPLTFTPEDIKYVIIKDDSEIHTMIECLRNIKSHFSLSTIDILTSKIITSKQIQEDF